MPNKNIDKLGGNSMDLPLLASNHQASNSHHRLENLKLVLRQNPGWGVTDVFQKIPGAIDMYSADQIQRLVDYNNNMNYMASNISPSQASTPPLSSPVMVPGIRNMKSLQGSQCSHQMSPRLIPREASGTGSAGFENCGESFSSWGNRTTSKAPAERYPFVPAKWQKGQLLGSGSFGEVWKGIRLDGTFFAVKIMSLKPDMEMSEVKKLMSEVKTMAGLQHPQIVEYYGCTYDNECHQLNIFMEYVVGGSVGKMVRDLREVLCVPTAQNYIAQILAGVAFLHSRSIIHRDLKGDNILISGEGIKLSDFGTCKRLKDFTGTMEAATTQARTMIGTPLWMAPEVISGSGEGKDGYGTPADIWSVGCVMVEMINRGAPPWPPFPNNWKAILTIGQWKQDMPPAVPAGLSVQCYDFLGKCFRPNPQERHTAEQLLQHRFLREVNEMRPAEQMMLEEITEMIHTRTPRAGSSSENLNEAARRASNMGSTPLGGPSVVGGIKKNSYSGLSNISGLSGIPPVPPKNNIESKLESMMMPAEVQSEYSDDCQLPACVESICSSSGDEETENAVKTAPMKSPEETRRMMAPLVPPIAIPPQGVMSFVAGGGQSILTSPRVSNEISNVSNLSHGSTRLSAINAAQPLCPPSSLL
eukprot:TRINITY_DN10606_c0_g1_i1.p1 TRINITY_DN10606_c0_g1~~TRINITY_DN10606_c0_g1_i1.p1  ORF type:complete len:703 (+),score=136.93 TRINITY_DN10606_c0_g1_i1:183-2111(+)